MPRSEFAPADSSPIRRTACSTSARLAEKGSPARSALIRPEVNNQIPTNPTTKSFGAGVKRFFNNLWAHKALLGAGILSIGVGLITLFVDVVGMGLPAPFLAPLTFSSFAVGSGYIALAILLALYETINDSVTLHTKGEKKQFVLDMLNQDHLNFDEICDLYDAIVEKYSASNEHMDLCFPPPSPN